MNTLLIKLWPIIHLKNVSPPLSAFHYRTWLIAYCRLITQLGNIPIVHSYVFIQRSRQLFLMTEQSFCILIITASQFSCREVQLLPLPEGIQVRCSASVWAYSGDMTWMDQWGGSLWNSCYKPVGKRFFSPAIAATGMMKASRCQGPSHKAGYPARKEPTYQNQSPKMGWSGASTPSPWPLGPRCQCHLFWGLRGHV